MITLGIHDGHNATACLIKDGKIVACIPEERLQRKKNWCGFPEKAIQACLEVGQISAADIDRVGVAGLLPPVHGLGEITDPIGFRGFYNFISPLFPRKFLRSGTAIKLAVFLLSKLRNRKDVEQRVRALGIAKTPEFYDHHSMHVLSAYGCSPFYRQDEEVLVLSCDGAGDAVCATVNIGKGGKLKRLHTVCHYNSLGELYARATQYLGMDPTSDEYKVMGLAAYANKKYGMPAYEKIKDFISVEQDGLGLRNNTSYTKWHYLKIMRKLFRNERFDCVAYAVQRMTEEVLTAWVINAVRKTGLRRVVLSGGIFMNIKTNNIILNHEEIEGLWVLPSCSDDSLSIGAAMQASINSGHSDFEPLKDLYLGPQYSTAAIEQALSAHQAEVKVQHMDNIEEHVGKALAQGDIIGRFAGGMEWGSRALGNRSILADPRDIRTVSRINKAIKKREFWMPYCPSILAERATDYFHQTKDYVAHYMVMAFPSTTLAQNDIPASMHAYDHTIRPQVVHKDWNPSYHKIISVFEKETGVGVLLNTSFNLSGYPIVCSPQDALDVFMKSDLDALAIENYYITKTQAPQQ